MPQRFANVTFFGADVIATKLFSGFHINILIGIIQTFLLFIIRSIGNTLYVRNHTIFIRLSVINCINYSIYDAMHGGNSFGVSVGQSIKMSTLWRRCTFNNVQNSELQLLTILLLLQIYTNISANSSMHILTCLYV